ncbi:uncharacterized protein LOC143533169 isoform X1 [Bidens hawaiensis]|uniref:uncharacterized protein LOC143533169 isoform X1 n=1 Tax=Bidens hawaiensis TaxID=980011 RepID=UPI004049147B
MSNSEDERSDDGVKNNNTGTIDDDQAQNNNGETTFCRRSSRSSRNTKPVYQSIEFNIPKKKNKKKPDQNGVLQKKEAETEKRPKCAARHTIQDQNKTEAETEKRFKCAARHMVQDENGVLKYVESVMCHQCQRNDKGRVVRCQKCQTKRYCVPCMTTWYPNMTEDMFADCCLDNCNCKS